ncbi:MAG: hypothetical protein KJ676_11825 [Alphaproteobacteria bacterium]|nr:hypothetical protein [Alphaproteobacteria bacterium]MBU1525971.1 hypothetical protein [Alphaproteobacteria bacterium]MBU2118374.1 hypothetical protein [Alphaproteobacteria bacterium]MBU2350379.1 hypothetical protein [Alphaproteobacteria bacterium]MBU2381613.1 hypothetical protein [Alphaproteobacteria bacterium]
MTRKIDDAAPETGAAVQSRATWQSPRIEDADISVLTAGGGTSGIEGTPFLKTGS